MPTSTSPGHLLVHCLPLTPKGVGREPGVLGRTLRKSDTRTECGVRELVGEREAFGGHRRVGASDCKAGLIPGKGEREGRAREGRAVACSVTLRKAWPGHGSRSRIAVRGVLGWPAHPPWHLALLWAGSHWGQHCLSLNGAVDLGTRQLGALHPSVPLSHIPCPPREGRHEERKGDSHTPWLSS